MNGRVGELSLTVRASPARWPKIRAQAESFAQRVLVRCDELLELRAPGRVLLLRTLDMRWRLHDAALDHEGEIDAVARAIAESLDARARAAVDAAPDDEIAVFADEAAWRAAHLRAVAASRGPTAWCFGRLEEEGEAPGALVRPETRELSRAVLARLARAEALADVLHALSASAVVAWARAAGGGEERDRAGSADARTEAKRTRAAAIAHLLAIARDATSSSESRAAGPGADGPAPPRDGAPAPGSGPRDAPASERSATPASARTDAALAPFDTRHGGLFYLLNAALELGVGERLWRACLDERAVLVHATRPFVVPLPDGAPDDAPSLFAGASLPVPLPRIAPEAHEELADGLLEAIVTALPRRGLASLPAMRVGVARVGSGRAVVAAPRGTAFALFVAPVASPLDASRALARFLDRWPRSAPVVDASPALAELDPRDRVRIDPGPAVAVEAEVDGVDPWSAALVAQIAGALGYLFAARVGADDATCPARLGASHLAIPGRVTLAHESMTVDLPMDRVDLDVRRSALDASPGWIPWLARRVEIRFVGGERLDLLDVSHVGDE